MCALVTEVQTFALPIYPYRIVVDLPQVAFDLPEDGNSRQVGAISGWRYGLFEPGTSRVVIDATAPMAVKSSFILPPSGSNGHRLVLDLVPKDRESFLVASNDSVARRVALLAPSLVAPHPGPVADSPAASRPLLVHAHGPGGLR